MKFYLDSPCFTMTFPGCHGNEICYKMGYNSVFVRDICEIFVFLGGFWGWAIECCQQAATKPHLLSC